MAGALTAAEPIALGDRRELFVDEALIEHLTGGAVLRLHHPEPRNVAMTTDRPWEGNACHYRTVFRDGDVVRMYYQTWHYDVAGTPDNPTMSRPHPAFLCYAESRDGGVTFTRPSLGLYEFAGSTDNNILFDRDLIRAAGFTIAEAGVSVFKDASPAAQPDAKYKAVAIVRKPGSRRNAGLAVLKSPDGLRWSLMHDEPVITEGRFDSQNLAFYDAVRGEYRAYHRGVRNGIRGIMTETSPDMITWTKPRWLDFGDAPPAALYTSQITPYPRAPHILVGFPLRYVERDWSPVIEALPGLEQRRMRAAISSRFGAAMTEALFMASRDGHHFRRYDEAFIRPRGDRAGWVYGDNSVAWGLVETPADDGRGPREISMYVVEGYWIGKALNVRRWALRADGFVSVSAPLAGGEMVTKPITFTGSRLALNLATSAAGGIRVELQDSGGRALPGFALAECPTIFGDRIAHVVHWAGGADVSTLAGRTVRLRFELRDADLYAFRFGPADHTTTME